MATNTPQHNFSAAKSAGSTAEPPVKRQRIEMSRSSNAPGSTFDVDPNGDLVVGIGTEPTLYMRISAKHMTMISRPFRRMLGPDFAEGQSTHDTIDSALKLPEDDPDGMRLLFQMAHLQAQDPKTIDVRLLPHVLIACDKWDCLKVFQFLLRELWNRWLDAYGIVRPKPATQTTEARIDTDILVESVCMAYIFRDRARFTDSMQLLFKHATGREIRDMSDLALIELMPAGFLDGLVAAWSSAVSGSKVWVCETMKEWVDELAREDVICDRTQRRLGSAIHGIKKHKLEEQEADSDPDTRFSDTEKHLDRIFDDLVSKDEEALGGRKPKCPCKRCASWRLRTFAVKPWKEHIATWGCSCLECFKAGKYDADPEIRGCQHARGSNL